MFCGDILTTQDLNVPLHSLVHTTESFLKRSGNVLGTSK